MADTPKAGLIRVGMGGWNYEPWRKTFYRPGTPAARELEYASRQVSAIEINGTFYRLQNPSVYAKWRDATPDDFVFSLKAPRFVVQRKDLATAGQGIDRFLESGITELRHKLGPILWQFAPTRRFDETEVEAFLKLLPPTADDLALRHALEVRHASFMSEAFLVLARRYDVAVVFVDDAEYPGCADLTSSFVYARLRRCIASEATGYKRVALKQWASRALSWAQGSEPSDLPRVGQKPKRKASPRDVFVYFINGAKERAPAAAQALLALLD